MAAALAITLCAGCGADRAASAKSTYALGFVNGASTEFHTCLQKAVEGEATRRGVRVITANSKQDPKAELSNIENLIAQNVDAVIVQTVSTDALKADIAKAGAAKIPIFLTSVAPADTGSILGAVAVDLNQVGLLDASWVSNDAVGAPGTAAVIAGAPGAASDLLVKGFTDNLPKNIKVVASKPGMFNRAKAKAVAAAMIKEHPDLGYAFVANEDMAVGASEAFRSAGKGVKIVTVNGTDTGLAGIEDGRFAATVSNPASRLGQQAVENTISLLNSEPIDKIDYVAIDLITKIDLAQAPSYCLID
ncbi:ribose transport system substrate-binding protein [Actinoplanes tereljensis]|uniref:Ribose ABC transporter substrate-binding protein n=1 Tax=Paractinoplanes tereljensis TaxID=571912 RepID=A0A919NVX3_9ACTN|nr:sugar ABC transporter substrate-binding protein [Actinoplanes tereljensis]GIF25333.1 ribose ABC transporter substrate-binding protein [Actinoplanes tereljensis]